MRTALARMRAGLASLTGTGPGASVVLAFLVIATVFVAVAMPRASLSYRTKALRQLITATSAPGRAVLATADFSDIAPALIPGASAQLMGPGLIGRVGGQIGGNLIRSGLALRPVPQRWWSLTTNYLVASKAPKPAFNGSTPPQVEVVYRPALHRFSRLVSGRLPAVSSLTPTSARFEVAVTTATAAKWHLHPGSVLVINGAQETVTLAVTGIIRPRQAGSSFWTQDPNAAAVTFNSTKFGGFWLGAVFAAPAALKNIEAAYSGGNMLLSWEYPLALGSVNANSAGPLYNRLNGALASANILHMSQFVAPELTITSGLAAPLGQFVRDQSQVGSLLALLYVSLTVVSAVVLLLGGLLLAERRASEFSLIRARGGTRRQLAALALRAGVIAVLPAAAVGALAGAALTPGGSEPLAWWLAGITALVALAGVPLLAVRGPLAAVRARQDTEVAPDRAARTRRLVLDVTLVAAAAGGIAVLRGQGAPPPGSTDWYTTASPALVAVPAAIVMVRLYPVVVRWLVSLAGRRRSAGAYVGFARSARGSVSSVLPVFALVLALGVIAFGATLRAAVLRGDEAVSWNATGADVVVNAGNSSLPLNAAAQRAIEAVPGVDRSTVLTLLAGSAADGTTLAVVAVDPASYERLLAATPLRQPAVGKLAGAAGRASGGSGSGGSAGSASGGSGSGGSAGSASGGSGSGGLLASVPVLASPAAADSLSHGSRVLVGVTNMRMRVTGRVSQLPGVRGEGPFVVVSQQALAAVMGTALGAPNLMLIVGAHADSARITAVTTRLLPGATVSLRSRVLNSLTGAPLPHGAQASFEQGGAAAAALGAVILAIMLALGARPRELTLARLATMGLSPGQARRLVVAEVLPAIPAATTGGLACAWALAVLLGPALDLTPLTGSSAPVSVRADYAVLGYLAAALLVLAFVTLLAQAAAARVRGVARALRVGE